MKRMTSSWRQNSLTAVRGEVPGGLGREGGKRVKGVHMMKEGDLRW